MILRDMLLNTEMLASRQVEYEELELCCRGHVCSQRTQAKALSQKSVFADYASHVINAAPYLLG
jgi:hypothetical protein